ncbi:hypothetical protein GCM10009608_61800 [Pseudonocardia alaniniphila]
MHGTGPVGGTGTGGGTGTDWRGVSSGTNCSAAMAAPGGGGSCSLDGEDPVGAGPTVPGCAGGGADAGATSGDGEACWGADALEWTAARVVGVLDVAADATTMTTAQATITRTVAVDAIATQRRLQ